MPWTTFFFSRRRGFLPFFGLANQYLLLLSLCLLLAGHRSLGPLARPCVGVGALSVDGQAAPVPQPLIAANLDLALDVLVDRPAKVALDLIAVADPVAHAQHFLVGHVAHSRRRAHARAETGLERARAAEAVDVCERHVEALVTREVDSGDSCQRPS